MASCRIFRRSSARIAASMTGMRALICSSTAAATMPPNCSSAALRMASLISGGNSLSAMVAVPLGADDLQDVAGVYHHVLLAERDACPAAECFGRLPALPFDRGQLRLSGLRAPFQLPDAHMLADDLHAVLVGRTEVEHE